MFEEEYKLLDKGRCRPCEYARLVPANGGFKFLGCYHRPYTGKKLAELKGE